MSHKAFGEWIETVLVDPEKVSSAGLILVQDEHDEEPLIADVISVGADVKDESICPGVRVVADHLAGSQYEDLVFLREEEVLLVLEEQS